MKQEWMITRRRRDVSHVEINISGAKNAVLPLMAACLLSEKPVHLRNVPDISDVGIMKEYLEMYGATVTRSAGNTMIIDARNAIGMPMRNKPTQDIRASFLVAGPLLARFGQVKVYKAGGCNIENGPRPVDYHIDAFENMGADCVENSSDNSYTFYRSLFGKEIRFPEQSVGATENVMMAACLAEGRTIINNAAINPDIKDLVKLLRSFGASIAIDDNEKKIVIEGRNGAFFGKVRHDVIPDRIEAGTYAIMAAITGIKVTLTIGLSEDEIVNLMTPLLQHLVTVGVNINVTDGSVIIHRPRRLEALDMESKTYPGFPTDLLPQWVSLMTQANGMSTITDNIYSNRFAHVHDLIKMGANITKLSDRQYEVIGPRVLKGTRVTCKDLRGGIALIIAAMVAEGTTVVKDVQHVERGYGNLVENLKKFGLEVEELKPDRPGFYGGR